MDSLLDYLSDSDNPDEQNTKNLKRERDINKEGNSPKKSKIIKSQDSLQQIKNEIDVLDKEKEIRSFLMKQFSEKEEEMFREKIFIALDNIFLSLNKGKRRVFQLELFGSSSYHMFVPHSDLDVIVFSSINDETVESLKYIQDLIKNSSSQSFSLPISLPISRKKLLLDQSKNDNDKEKQCEEDEYYSLKLKPLRFLPNSRVPVLSLLLSLSPSSSSSEVNIQVDIVSYSEREIENGRLHQRLIRNWALEQNSKYPFLSCVMRLIKYLVGKNQINAPYYNFLPSLAYLVMIIYVIENPNIDSTFSCSSLKYIEKKSKFQRDKTPIISILLLFFLFYSNWPHETLIATNESFQGSLEKFKEEGIKKDYEFSGFGHTVYIQDPFLKDVNLGRFVTELTFLRLKNIFKDCLELLIRFCESNNNYNSEIILKKLFIPKTQTKH